MEEQKPGTDFSDEWKKLHDYLVKLPSYDAAKQQVFCHNGGQMMWVDTATCSDGSK